MSVASRLGKAIDRWWQRLWFRMAVVAIGGAVGVMGTLAHSAMLGVVAWTILGGALAISAGYVAAIVRLLLGEWCRNWDQRLLNVLHCRGELDGLTLAKRASFMAGTIHPRLARLERQGLVVSRWETDDPDVRPRRRLYRLAKEDVWTAR